MPQNKLIDLGGLSEPSQSPGNLTFTRLVKTLTEDPQQHLVLITQDMTENNPAVVMGASLPHPLFHDCLDIRQRPVVQACTSQVVFQLAPRFQLVNLLSPPRSLDEFIHRDDGFSSSDALAANNETAFNHSKPYWIGSIDREWPHLYIDPENKSATLRSAPLSANIRKEGLVLGEAWETTVQPARFDFFRVSGRMITSNHESI